MALSKHDRVLSELVERLYPRHDMVARNVEYMCRGICGEVDALTYDRDKNKYIFWEVKSTYGSKQYKKAREQFKKYCDCYPNRNVSGVMVTPKRIRRLYNLDS